MNGSIRKVALALGIAMVALFVQLNYDQVIAAHRFTTNAANRRQLVKEYSTQRGDIIASGQVIASSAKTNDRLRYVRQYPLKDLTAEITGYYSLIYGGAGLERRFNDYLTGSKPARVSNLVDDLLGRDRKGNSLLLTLDLKLQRIAKDKLGNQRGAAVAIQPETGEVLALYSNPSFDPGGLSSHDTGLTRRTWDAYNNDPLHPLVARAFQERYPPGSTFKVVVAAAGLEAGIKPTDTFPNPRGLKLPLSTKVLANFGGGTCRGGGSRISFADGLRVSCNSTFAQIGMQIGRDKLVAMAEKFGLDRAPEFDLGAVPSCIRTAPTGCAPPDLDVPQTALSSIGQFDVRVTPLEMAIVAATVANGGRVPRPHLVKEIQDFAGRPIEPLVYAPSAPIYSAETAANLRAMMINVVRNGTGRPAAVDGVEMGGKTGTAQTGSDKPPHSWFIAFAPGIAVAVVVENGGNLGDEATGGKVAGPIAKALIEEVVHRPKSG